MLFKKAELLDALYTFWLNNWANESCSFFIISNKVFYLNIYKFLWYSEEACNRESHALFNIFFHFVHGAYLYAVCLLCYSLKEALVKRMILAGEVFNDELLQSTFLSDQAKKEVNQFLRNCCISLKLQNFNGLHCTAIQLHIDLVMKRVLGPLNGLIVSFQYLQPVYDQLTFKVRNFVTFLSYSKQEQLNLEKLTRSF